MMSKNTTLLLSLAVLTPLGCGDEGDGNATTFGTVTASASGSATLTSSGSVTDSDSDTDTDTGGGTSGGSATASGGTTGATTNTSTATSGNTTNTTTATATATDSGGGMVTIAPGDMIDDLEDGDGLIIVQAARQGAWYTYNDGTVGATQTPMQMGTFTPIAGGANASSYSANTNGSGFVLWGAGMGVDLNNAGDGMGGAGMKLPYNASNFTGIAFWAKGNASIRVKLQIPETVDVAEGGTCTVECSDTHGMGIPLSPEWTQYVIPFSQAVQEGWGTAASFDASQLLGVQFQVSPSLAFDITVDDLGFYI